VVENRPECASRAHPAVTHVLQPTTLSPHTDPLAFGDDARLCFVVNVVDIDLECRAFSAEQQCEVEAHAAGKRVEYIWIDLIERGHIYICTENIIQWSRQTKFVFFQYNTITGGLKVKFVVYFTHWKVDVFFYGIQTKLVFNRRFARDIMVTKKCSYNLCMCTPYID
jgi:hypothetical protein